MYFHHWHNNINIFGYGLGSASGLINNSGMYESNTQPALKDKKVKETQSKKGIFQTLNTILRTDVL